MKTTAESSGGNNTAQPNIYRKLMKARLALQAIAVKKTGKNTFTKHEYMGLADFLPATQQIFAEVGLCGIVSFTNELAILTIHDADSDQTITITSPMGSADLKGCHVVQNIGAVETYQRRYLWMTAFEIVEHDALDSGDIPKNEPETITARQQVAVQKLMDEAKVSGAKFCQFFKISGLSELRAEDYERAISELEKKKAALAEKEAVAA